MNKKILIAYCAVSIFLLIGVADLLYNLSPLFKSVNERIKNGETIVMNGEINACKLDSILCEKGGYLADPDDSRIVSEWYSKKIGEGDALDNLGAINTSSYRIPIDSAIRNGGSELRERAKRELERLGQNDEYKSIDKKRLSAQYGEPSEEKAKIPIRIKNADKVDARIDSVVVRLSEYYIKDSLEANKTIERRTVCYAVTDKNGEAIFYVKKGHYYSALPISEGYAYGVEKGTIGAPLSSDLKVCQFIQSEHRMTALSNSTYHQMKNDYAIISRTPRNYIYSVISAILLFIAAWGFVLISTKISNSYKKSCADSWLLIAIMTLTGIGLLVLFGQMRPLTDIFYGMKMFWATIIGCAGLIFFSNLNYVGLYQRYNSWFPNKVIYSKSTWINIFPAYPFLIAALLLMILLRLMGSGPEGSDAKVNLLGFQPSEVIKYLIIVFITFYFLIKGEVIKIFGESVTKLTLQRQIAIIGTVLALIAIVCFVFLGLLKDMGPAIVILTTFIVLFSIVRRDFSQLLLGFISFVLVVGLTYFVTPRIGFRVAVIVLWFIGWIIYGILKDKDKVQIFESAIFLNFLISLFLIGGYLLRRIYPTLADRLLHRTNMAWFGIFDNAVPQGDQIAQGLWGTASGGFFGMGIGGGSSYFIPAGHTDLILSSLGEQMGWIGIILVSLCFFILIQRTISAAQYSGNRFTFYLTLGIGILTVVQFLFVALGCVGIIPLSGVPVPFLSYSRTGIIMVLCAYGIVLSVSRNRGSEEAIKQYVHTENSKEISTEEAKSVTSNLRLCMFFISLGIVSIIFANGYFQVIEKKSTMIRPVKTANNRYLRILDYNPRIIQLENLLSRGNIYDRNGMLLASSNKNDLIGIQEQFDSLGIKHNVTEQVKVKHKRYYPFGSSTVFFVGDLNNADVYRNELQLVPMGYLAEKTNEMTLKGYSTYVDTIQLHSSAYRYHRFWVPKDTVITSELRDYSCLLSGLSKPLYRNSWVKKFNRAQGERDLYLTIDAVLQTNLQEKMAMEIKSNPTLKRVDNLRASVVILDAKNGDLLTSSNYPLPEVDSIVKIRKFGFDRKRFPSEWMGGPTTERDLGMTFYTPPGSTAKVMSAMAGFVKLKKDAYDKGYTIKQYMTVEPPTKEPNEDNKEMNRGHGRQTFMENAIKHSSNCYFVMLVNEEDLYNELGGIYKTVGTSLGSEKTKSYYFDTNESIKPLNNNVDAVVREYRTHGLNDYNKYITDVSKSKASMSTIQEYTGIAWGQSTVEATPLNMARVAGIVGNDGVYVPTRYVLDGRRPIETQILDNRSADLLSSAMRDEASRWWTGNYAGRNRILPQSLEGKIGGKTGTAEYKDTNALRHNFGWYICYIKNSENDKTLAIAIRLEHLPKGITSKAAVQFLSSTVLPALKECNYIK